MLTVYEHLANIILNTGITSQGVHIHLTYAYKPKAYMASQASAERDARRESYRRKQFVLNVGKLHSAMLRLFASMQTAFAWDCSLSKQTQNYGLL